MLARKGIAATIAASSRHTLRSGISHQDQSAALSFRINRLFSSSKTTLQTSEPARIPRPIPLDIGNSPSVSALPQASSTGSQASLSSVGTEAATATKKKFRSYNSGSVFSRFGEPAFNVIVYATASSLLLHLIYNYLALEEFRISSGQKIADLEAEIATLKLSSSKSVQHSLGGRGEFI
ncbi:hypothetical protein BGZ46_007062 [Entomortierella lignicola]|nr:hypothetical protein BGZ46_007062 [Entomortierella lignicola]